MGVGMFNRADLINWSHVIWGLFNTWESRDKRVLNNPFIQA